jgi:hypothetical protein
VNTNGGPGHVVPLRFDLASLVRRSVASLYSHLITRPTGQALRLGIESQIGEMGELCLSVLDFTQVAVLDYSCADETVAKLLLRFQPPDRPADAYFVLRGVDEHHREALEAVLDRHGLAVVELGEGGAALLGAVTPLERLAWLQLTGVGRAGAGEIAARLDAPLADVAAALERLAARRVVVRRPPAEGYYALVALLQER